VVRHLGIAENTWNRWRCQYGGMKADVKIGLLSLCSQRAATGSGDVVGVQLDQGVTVGISRFPGGA
jgi:hypothetical protein